MTPEQKDMILSLALKEIARLQDELAAADDMLRSERDLRARYKGHLDNVRGAVARARVLRETTDLKDFRVHLVEEDWDRIDTLLKETP